MAVHEIPVVPSISDYRFDTVLVGTPLVFDLHWNARDSSWYMDIRNPDETEIVCGVRIVLGAFLARQTVTTPIPEGIMVAVDTSQSDKEAGFDDFGTRVKLRFYPIADWLALLSLIT